MTDHIDGSSRARPTRKIVGVRELKTHAAWDAFVRAGRRLERRFRRGVSGVDILSTMRR